VDAILIFWSWLLSFDFIGENEVAIIEQMELVRHRSDIIADVKNIVEKYRTIFSSDLSQLDKNVVDKLVLVEIHSALKEYEKNLLG
jgi:hypothetical protein